MGYQPLRPDVTTSSTIPPRIESPPIPESIERLLAVVVTPPVTDSMAPPAGLTSNRRETELQPASREKEERVSNLIEQGTVEKA